MWRAFPDLVWLIIGQHTMLIDNGDVIAARPEYRLDPGEEGLLLSRMFAVNDVGFDNAWPVTEDDDV